MNVALVGYMHGRGGIQTHTHFLALGLSARRHSVTVVTPPPMAGHECAAGSAHYRYLVYRGTDFIGGLGAGRPDVAVVCGTGWKAMAGVLALPRPCRRVFFEVMSGTRSRLLDPRALVRLGFHAVVGQGTLVERRFKETFGWKGRSTTIPALPEPLERAHCIPARRMEAPKRGTPLRFAYFGRLVAHKGIALLVDRWHDFAPPGSHLDVFGTGSEEQSLAVRIARAGLDQAIRLRGPYPSGPAYIKLLQQYHLKLLPTTGDEGAPIVLLEAMACGLPFVANGVGGIPDYANPDCEITTGRIEQFVPAVRQIIEKLYSGRIDNKRLQQHYRRTYSFETLVDRWETFLSGLVTTGSAG